MKSSTEINDAITEIERPFGSPVTKMDDSQDVPTTVRGRQALLRDIIQSRYDYRAAVNPLHQNKIAVPPVTLLHYVQERVANLRNDLQLHLEPVGSKKREESAADRMEVAEAHDLIMLDPWGFLRESIHQSQVQDLFWAGLLEAVDFIKPEQGKGESDADYIKRVEQAMAGHFPFRLRHLHPQTVAWMEHERDPTAAVIRYKLPIVDLLERYTEGRRDNPEKLLDIFNRDYGWLMDERQPVSGSQDWWGKQVEVVQFIDAGVICHYVDCSSSGLKREKGYRGVGETEYPNHFGDVPLHIAEGVYYPHEELAYRRGPMLQSLVNTLHAQSIMLSNWASQVANGGWPVAQLPPEVAKALIDSEQQAPAMKMEYDKETGLPIPMQPFGDFKFVTSDVDPSADKLFAVMQQWENRTSPSSLLFDPDAASRLGSIPSTTVLAQLSENNRMGGWAERSEKNVWNRVLDEIWHYRRVKLNGHRKKGDAKQDKDWGVSFTATGKEQVQGKAIKRGEAYDISAQDMDGEYVRTLSTVDNSAASRTARRQEAIERRGAGTILEREYLELNGVVNVTEFVTKYNAEQMFKVEAPVIMTEARQRRLQFIAARDGRNPEELLTLAGVQPQFSGGDEGRPEAGSMYRMGSPHVDGVGASSDSRSVQ